MEQITKFKDKHIVVLGLAISGYNAAKLLVELGAIVTLADKNTTQNEEQVKELEQLGVRVVLGEHPDDLLNESVAYVVKNPGIPYTVPVVQQALTLKIPIITDVELAYSVATAPIISITGSNGKTTTTSLIANMLNASATNTAHLAGNIGIPATLVAKKAQKDDVIVMEMSSFQLMGIETFRPKIALFVNIFDAHLDYHGSREAYVEAKLNLLNNQTPEDSAVFNGDLEESVEFAKKAKGKVYYFSKYDDRKDAYVKDGVIYVFDQPIVKTEAIQLIGEHNLENVLAAILVTKLYGQTNEHIEQALRQFHGVKHRSQFVKAIHGRKFYNDSKATNILATKMALSGFQTPVILIAGGLDRGNTFETLEPSLKHVRVMIVYGQTKEKLQKSALHANVPTVVVVDTLQEAVEQAYALSQEHDNILFSPACASWDQFPNFEVRGDAFIAYVETLQ